VGRNPTKVIASGAMVTSLAAQAFPSLAIVPFDLLRIAIVVAAALIGGLLVWEIRLRWQDRTVWYQLAAALIFGAPLVLGEMHAIGTPPTGRLALVCAGMALVAAGIVRTRRQRRAAVEATRVARTRTMVLPPLRPGVARGIAPFVPPPGPPNVVRMTVGVAPVRAFRR